MNDALRFPGVSNAWTMPVKNRIDMLTTGVRTPVGIKIFGPDLAGIERIGTAIERVLPQVSGTRSVFAERVSGGYFLDFDLKRDQLARYGMSVEDAEAVVTVGDRRREREHGHPGAGAVPDQRALLPRFAQLAGAAAPRAGAGRWAARRRFRWRRSRR